MIGVSTESVLQSDPSWFILIYYLAIADLFISADLTCVLHPLVSLIWPCLPAMLTMDLLPTHPSHFLYLVLDQTTSAHTLLCRARHGVSTLLSHLRWRGRRQGHKAVVVLGEHPVFESTHWSTVCCTTRWNRVWFINDYLYWSFNLQYLIACRNNIQGKAQR